VTGVSAGAVGVLPADALHSGPNRLPIAVVTTVSRSRGSAALVAFEGWTSAAGTPTTDVAAVVATDDVTAGTATGVALGAPAGLDCDAAPGDTAALEADLTEVSVAEVEWAGGEAVSAGKTLCFGRRLDRAVDSSTSLADELTWPVPVCGTMP
jgi:hypothetical protein